MREMGVWLHAHAPCDLFSSRPRQPLWLARFFFFLPLERAMLHVQAHRGARSSRPENTLPAFETALDLGVDSIETDLHLTRDGVVVVFHDDAISARLCRPQPGEVLPRGPQARLHNLTLAQLRTCTADAILTTHPRQAIPPSPVAQAFLSARGLSLYMIPTLGDLLDFLTAYEGQAGHQAGKTPEQQEKARRTRLDLELKGDPWQTDQTLPGVLERETAAAIGQAGWVKRVCIRSFDHRRVWAFREIEPALRTGLLLAGTRVIDSVQLTRAAQAQEIYPDYQQVDASLVRAVREAGLSILPWTVNDPDAWERLADWGVDGITTDFPGELLAWLKERD